MKAITPTSSSAFIQQKKNRIISNSTEDHMIFLLTNNLAQYNLKIPATKIKRSF